MRALLVRLTVEEPMGEPDDVVLQLVRDAARRELHLITGRGPDLARRRWRRPRPPAAWVQELDDPGCLGQRRRPGW